MFPTLLVGDGTSLTGRDAKAESDGLKAFSVERTSSADSDDIGLSNSGLVMSSAGNSCSVLEFIRFVLFGCGPSEIDCAIIPRITISMCCVVTFRGAPSVEGLAHNYMYRSAASQQSHLKVSPGPTGVQHNAGIEMPSAIGEPSIKRPNAPKARRFIAGMARYRAPLFNLCYRLLSHRALLKRRGQGMTEGCNQPSFPIYNRQCADSIGITILAARV